MSAVIPVERNGWELVKVVNETGDLGEPGSDPNPWYIVAFDKGQVQTLFRARKNQLAAKIEELFGPE